MRDLSIENAILSAAINPISALEVAGSSASRRPSPRKLKVEPEHQHGDRKSRKDRQVGGVEEVGTASVDHRAPARRGRLEAQAEETERRLRENRRSHAERRLHGYGGKRSGDDMSQQDAPYRRAHRARRLDELEFTRAQQLTTYQPRVSDPPDQ